MAALADYPVNIIPNDMNDFVLFPGQESYTDLMAHHHQARQQENDYDVPPAQQFYAEPALDEYSLSNAAPMTSSYDSYRSAPAFAGSYETPQLVVQAPHEASKQRTTFPTPPQVSPAHSFEHPPSTLSSASGASVASAASSAIGSPYSNANQFMHPEQWSHVPSGLGLNPSIVQPEGYGNDLFVSAGPESDSTLANDKLPHGCVDPSLIQQPFQTLDHPVSNPPQVPNTNAFYSPQQSYFPPSHSPALSHESYQNQRSGSARLKAGSQSPYLRNTSYQPYPSYGSRRPSVSSDRSRFSNYGSQGSPRSGSLETDEDGHEKGKCPNVECGKVFKDLKAHMLTHQAERPEKCPIVTCEYHQKGFARKYDKQRHTLTHYKGTMVCGFCPHSGSSAEKSFNRADVFKRHLTAVHGVEQTAPNSRKKATPSGTSAANRTLSEYPHAVTGKCSTCSGTFSNAQEFYEHLDECVLRIVQQAEPSEAINQANMASVQDDQAVEETLRAHALPTTAGFALDASLEEEDDDEDDEDDDTNDQDGPWMTSGSSSVRSRGDQSFAKSAPTTRGSGKNQNPH